MRPTRRSVAPLPVGHLAGQVQVPGVLPRAVVIGRLQDPPPMPESEELVPQTENRAEN